MVEADGKGTLAYDGEVGVSSSSPEDNGDVKIGDKKKPRLDGRLTVYLGKLKLSVDIDVIFSPEVEDKLGFFRAPDLRKEK